MTAAGTARLGSDDCGYYERHGVIAEERGEPVPDHVAGCATCLRRQGQIQRLRRLLEALPAPASQGNWQQAVWQEIATRQQRRTRNRRLVLLVGAPLAAAAVIVLALFFRPPQRPPAALAFASYIEAAGGPAVRRNRDDVGGGTAGIGDFWVLEASGLGQAFAEVRIYQQNRGLVLRCASESPCARTGDALHVRWRLPAIGRYRAVLLWGTSPLPEPTGAEDEDLARLRDLGVAWREFEQFAH